MTEVYTAPTNGHEIRSTPDGGLRINKPGMDYVAGHEPQTLVVGRVESLREYFRDERDRKLGRWRWPEHPEYVVRKVPDSSPETVIVINESYGPSYTFTRTEPLPGGNVHSSAARAYFEAHPVPRPWHDAMPGEVWIISTTHHESEFAVQATVDRKLRSAIGFEYEVTDKTILSGGRIWPESEES